MRHPWVNLGQKEPLRPFCVPPCDKDQGVTVVRTLVSGWDLIHDSGNRQQALHCELRGTQGGGLLHHCEALPPSTDLSSHNLSLLQGLRCPHSYHVAQAGKKGTTSGGPGVREEDQGACQSPPSLEQKPAIPSPAPRVALRPAIHQQHQQQD